MKRHKTTVSFFQSIPEEVQISILTYLRSKDLATFQGTCQSFNAPNFITKIINYTATQVYPRELTEGFDHIVRGNPTPRDANGYFTNYEPMRNIEILVVARVLSRPEPPPHERSHSFYVSKAWCKSALQWLESQQPPNISSTHPPTSGKKKGKKEKKKARMRSQKLCQVAPPLPNVNHDLTCEHGDLRHCSSKSAKARRRVMDKQAWKVLKKLYPDSVQLNALQPHCWQCAMELETSKKQWEAQKEAAKMERMQPLSNPLIRAFYTRSNKGFPVQCLVPERKVSSNGYDDGVCPLVPGVYSAIPRAWCHRWRKYVKSGGERPTAPDSSSLLCDAHKLPLVPNHLEAFLSGETPSLLCAMGFAERPTEDDFRILAPVGMARGSPSTSLENVSPSNHHPTHNSLSRSTTEDSFLAAGIGGMHLESELTLQRQALQRYQQQTQDFRERQQQIRTLRFPERTADENNHNSNNNDMLDRENKVVVEILTEDEFNALEEWWPEIHSSFVMKFAVTTEVVEGRDVQGVTWSTLPCRECDAGHCGTKILERNRNRNRNKHRCKKWKR